MKNLYILVLLFILLPVLATTQQIVSIYCTWDDLEAARQERIFGSGICAMMRNAGFSVTDKDYPNQATADSLITTSVRLVIGSSHGDATTFYDCQNWTAIWTSSSPAHLGPVKGKIVHLLACQNGQKLAPAMVNSAGALAVLAYKENFNFSSSSKYNDYCAGGDAEFDRSLVQDKSTTGVAFQNAKNKFIQYANIANSEGETGEYQTLMHNANCIALFGSTSGKITGTATALEEAMPIARAVPGAKFAKPSEAILKQIMVARKGRIFMNLHEYRTAAKAAKKTRKLLASEDFEYHTNLASDDYKDLCISHFDTYKDSYKLGIRADKSVLLDKNQMIWEIRNNTEIGQFLVKRYQNFVNTVETLVDED